MHVDVPTLVVNLLGLIGAVETSKHISPRVQGLVTVAVALVIGGVAGYLQLDGLNVTSGLLTAVGAIGLDTTANSLTK